MKKGKTKYINEIGNVYQHLTIESVESKASKNRIQYYFKCRCDCGNKKSILASSVIRGFTTSCGCRRDQYQKIAGNSNVNFGGYGEIGSKLWKTIIRKAKQRDLEFSISIEYAWHLYLKQNRKCNLSGLDIQFGPQTKASNTTASLDRIDSSKGYVVGNVQWVYKTINIMKNYFNQTEFIHLCKQVAQRNLNVT